MDEVFDQLSYYFNVEDDLKTFNEAMKSQDVTFWKEAIDDEIDSIMGNNTLMLADLPPVQVDRTKKFWSSRFSMKDIGEVDVILVNTPMDTSEKLMPNNGQVVSQLEYSRVISCLLYAMTCTRPDIAFVVGKLSSTKDKSSTSGWVFLLGGGVISWASKKQTCITGSTMEHEFMALAAVGKEAEWLKNLLLEIPLWSKPIAPIFIRCDNIVALAKAYSQMYNEKSRHLGVRHSMIRDLITTGVISIEFIRSQQKLFDHLRKGLARDLVISSMRVQFISVKGLEVRSVLPLVTEHPDSDSGQKEFISLMKFSEFTLYLSSNMVDATTGPKALVLKKIIKASIGYYSFKSY
nr:hypothetical protein [Tanacetum cinerariifolium]